MTTPIIDERKNRTDILANLGNGDMFLTQLGELWIKTTKENICVDAIFGQISSFADDYEVIPVEAEIHIFDKGEDEE